MWLGEEQGVTSVKELQGRWPATTSIRQPPTSSSMSSLLTIMSGLVGKEKQVSTEYAPYLDKRYFYEGSSLPEQEGWVHWRPEGVLGGRKPTNSQSSSFSTALRKLEERGLVELLKLRGKGQRVSHVRLTFEGEVASVLLHVGGKPTD